MVGEHCQRIVCTVSPDDTLREAAERMQRAGVGCVVVAQDERPVAILTDRDLALEVLCEGLDPDVVHVQAVMGHPPITIDEHEPLHAAARQIRAARVRRLPVVDASGTLVGLIAADDLMLHAADQLAHICQVIRRQIAAPGRPLGGVDAGG